MINRRIFSIFALVGLLLAESAATACQVPVFRYALERWDPQPFEVTVFRRGPLNQDEMAAAHALEVLAPPANLLMRDVDLDQTTDVDLQNLWKVQGDGHLPLVVVRGLGQDQDAHTLWSGPLDSADLKQLVDSPARHAIREKLMAGDSAVWIFVNGGNAQQDDAAFELLQTRLKALETLIHVPVPDPNSGPGESVLTDLPLKLSFPILRVSRADAEEKMFVRLLFTGDADSLNSKEPVVVPVFGRGRALVCMNGKDINSDRIEEVAMFLGGECSCQVKQLNPGYDLLVSADWNSLLRDHSASFIPPGEVVKAPAAPVFRAKPPEPPIVAAATLAQVKPAPVASIPAAKGGSRRMMLLIAIGAAGILVLVFGWLTFRPKPVSKELQ